MAGDLHDGTGLGAATTPDGEISIEIFSQLKSYDLLTIGMVLRIPCGFKYLADDGWKRKPRAV
jgi:hypothetical protein